MERGEGHDVGDVLDSEHGVGNGLDRECIDVVVGDVDKVPARVMILPLPTRPPLQQVQLEHCNNTFAANKILIADVVLAMVLIADVLALLMMIKQPERDLTTTAMAMAITEYEPMKSCSLISQPPWLQT